MFGSYRFCLFLGEADRHGHTSSFHANETLSGNLESSDSARRLYWRSFLHVRQCHCDGPKFIKSDQPKKPLLRRFRLYPVWLTSTAAVPRSLSPSKLSVNHAE